MGPSRLLGGLVVVALGCGAGSTVPDLTIASVALTPATVDTLFSLGDTVRLTASPRDRAGIAVPGAVVTFQSSAMGVATVSAEGLVATVGNGVATITATANGISTAVVIRVRQKLASTTVTPPTGGIAIGRTLTLAAVGRDLRGNAITGLPAPTFTSSNTGVATVSSGGVVTGVGLGSATITVGIASTADGTRSGTASITVTSAPPATATITMGATTFVPNSAEISVGGTVTWVNTSGVVHDVDFGPPSMLLSPFDTGQKSLTFDTAGTFAYRCNFHAGMTGTIVVR